jgi:hypothetical protein
MKPGDKVRIKANPSRIGILGSETDGPPHRLRGLVMFNDGDEDFVLLESLEKVTQASLGPYAMMREGRHGRARDLRGAITHYRLSGKLANLIYSLNTTNTDFLAYQFKPVVQYLDSPISGMLIADEVGLGKTIEAGLIWTELKAREDAKRLLVLCPAMLREKWRDELLDRFGVHSQIVGAKDLLARLQDLRERPHTSFALVASLQGLRPPRQWDDSDDPSQSDPAKLARFLKDAEVENALLDMTIVDEAHYLRNRETLTNTLARLIRPVSNHMLMLSATPIQLRSRDLFNLLNLLDDDSFPYELSFDQALEANAPLVALRDKILRAPVSQELFLAGLRETIGNRMFDDNEQIEYLIQNPPSSEELSSARGRSEIADQLDRINPLAKVVTRTLKRDVQEARVDRLPHTIRVSLNPVERDFYDRVTDAIRGFCMNLGISEGFMLTIPQRQMASSLPAAFRHWMQRDRAQDESEEVDAAAYDLYGIERPSPKRTQHGVLMKQLIAISREVGDYVSLTENDGKYQSLIAALRDYWAENPGNKIVLFSFYRATLHYLVERLAHDGIPAAVLHGGMDKHGVLRHFATPEGPPILLSSEVAAEGVDLQFSSLVINYDLPWNPARIEQRIGRIDRIGQSADRILIWNFVYADTVEERVYDRLLQRLGIFQQALGSMEAMLGETIQALSYELLSHKLSPEQEAARIDNAALVIETTNRTQAQLEEQATHLIAHGEFIQHKVRAARDLGRFIRGADLLAYVKDFLEPTFSGTRLLSTDLNPLECVLEWSSEARADFGSFIQQHRLQGTTRLLEHPPPRLEFENRVGRTPRQIERITQAHPLVRFTTERLRSSASTPPYSQTAAIKLLRTRLGDVSSGTYVYAVSRWSVSGAREIERLEYLMKELHRDNLIEGQQAEFLVNAAAIEGTDWLASTTAVDHPTAAEAIEDCRSILEERFQHFQSAQARENRDRIKLMVKSIESHIRKQSSKIEDRIAQYELSQQSSKLRMIPAERGRLKKLAEKLNDRIAELRGKEDIQTHQNLVSVGLVCIE